MGARPSILAHNYEHKVFNLINHRVTIQEAHSAVDINVSNNNFKLVMAITGQTMRKYVE